MVPPAKYQLGIIGYPIGHALSPLMHNAAIEALGLNYEYQSIGIPPEALAREYRMLVDAGYLGLNVTIPHKQAIIEWLDEIDPTAQAIGAVNTIEIRNQKSRGYNTDALGFLRSVEPVAEAIEGKTVLMLGSGGAARAVFYGLVTQLHPSEIVIAARNRSKAEKLIDDLARSMKGNTSFSLISNEGEEIRQTAARASAIINATPLGMHPNTHESPLPGDDLFSPEQVAIDLVYNPIQTAFLSSASRAGSRTLDGLGMLIYQGAAAFKVFTGVEMPVEVVRDALKRKLRES